MDSVYPNFIYRNYSSSCSGFGSVIPDVTASLISAFEQFPIFVNRLINFFENFDFAKFNFSEDILLKIEDFLTEFGNQILVWLKTTSTNLIYSSVKIVSNVVGLIINGFLALTFCIYLLLYKRELTGQSHRFVRAFFPEERGKSLILLVRMLSSSFTNFLSGVAIEAVIFGVMSFVVMKVAKLPFASSIALINALATFIPYFGAFIGGAIGFVLIMTISIKKAFLFLFLIILMQQIEGNIIYPKVVGDKVGLPGIWVMVSVSIGGAIFGLVGMVFAVPVATFIFNTVSAIVDYRIRRKEGENVQFSDVLIKLKKNREEAA